MIKRTIAILCVFATLCLTGIVGAFAETPAYARHLQFNDDGKFTVLQVADIQDSAILLPPTKELIIRSIETVKPDLIVLSGDNIAGYLSDSGLAAIDRLLVEMAIDSYMSIFEDYGIPVAAVFGNHDAECAVTKEEQMTIYGTYDCFVGYDEGGDIYGCGNYNVPIYASDDSAKIAYNFWLLDSGMHDMNPDGSNNGYDYVHQDQIDWYKSTSDTLKAQNGGALVPSMVFQHIVVPDVYDYLLEVPEGTEGAVGHGGKYYTLDPALTRTGVMHEAPAPSRTNSGEFQAMVAQGDVVAMFFGHDHVNTYEIETPAGVDLVSSPGCTFSSYGDEMRGCRAIVLDESDLSTYTTHAYTYAELFAGDDEAALHFEMYATEIPLEERIGAGLLYIFSTYILDILGSIIAVAL